jgi:GNAT superfamily N-acetyltransferase
LRFQVEHLSGIYLEMQPFFKAHYDELAIFKDKIAEVEPDWDLYASLEEGKHLHVVTARESGKLVGYFIGCVMPHPHYKSISMCSADLYYLDPDCRKAQNGIRFLQFIEYSVRERGIQLLTMGTKMHKDLGALYEALHFTETDRVFRKWLA